MLRSTIWARQRKLFAGFRLLEALTFLWSKVHDRARLFDQDVLRSRYLKLVSRSGRMASVSMTLSATYSTEIIALIVDELVDGVQTATKE